MSDSAKQLSENVAEFQLHGNDTGSADVQIVRLTDRIKQLTDHMSVNKKDKSSRRGLLRLVARRRKLLDYLARTENDRYQKVISTLGLRR
ncbi:MAG: 30S ribosomal protein S15 [Verrucomicrobiota bacterium]